MSRQSKALRPMDWVGVIEASYRPGPTDDQVLDAAVPAARKLSVGERRRWARVAAHIAAGLRLRRRRGALPVDPFAGAEAVLDAHGRLEHAEAPAQASREILREAALAMDRARR